MAILNQSVLRDRGTAAAQRCRSKNQRLVLIYCGVIALLTLGTNGLHLYLDSYISGTGGLSGLGTRSVLQTIQKLLVYINFSFGPFWAAGFLYAMLSLVRGRTPGRGDLMEGFRRFGRVLAHMCFQFLILAVLMIIAVNAAAVIYSVTIVSTNLFEEMEVLTDPAIITGNGQVDLSKIPADVLQAITVIPLIMAGLLLIPVYTWLSYHFRMSLYLVMERPIGGVQACFESMRLMRGHKWQMFRLDLHFWWYHLLGVLITLVGYLDAILTTLGIPLPLDTTGMFILIMLTYCVLQTGLFLWKKCQVDATYMLAYEAIAYPEPAQAGTDCK